MYATFNRFEIQMTLAQAQSASHPGPCDSEVAALVALPHIRRQLDKIPPADIAAELQEYGAWDETELQDQQANRARIIWCAACDIWGEYSHPHTPGPWKIIKDVQRLPNSKEIQSGDNKVLAEVFTDIVESKANAALIAAAPELLEALQIMVVSAEYMAEKGLPFPVGIERARAALAKARGE